MSEELTERLKKTFDRILSLFRAPKKEEKPKQWWEVPAPPDASKEELAERMHNLERLVRRQPKKIRVIQGFVVVWVLINLYLLYNSAALFIQGYFDTLIMFIYLLPSTWVYFQYLMLLRWRVREHYEQT